MDGSHALDAVLGDPRWSGHIDGRRISVVGFALGKDRGPDMAIGADGPRRVRIADVTRFDAFSACTPAGPAILAKGGGEPALCGASAKERMGAHERIAAPIISFLTGSGGKAE